MKTIGTVGQQIWSSAETAGDQGGPDDALPARSMTWRAERGTD